MNETVLDTLMSLRKAGAFPEFGLPFESKSFGLEVRVQQMWLHKGQHKNSICEHFKGLTNFNCAVRILNLEFITRSVCEALTRPLLDKFRFEMRFWTKIFATSWIVMATVGPNQL